jgi:phosphoglycolate phosphatase-like HAD superfamily hydrolase
MARPLYIFDMDGTIADISHRLSLRDEKLWDDFYDACDKDAPIAPMLTTMDLLSTAGAECWVWTGRRESSYDKTVEWLSRRGVAPDQVRMRAEGDRRPDWKVKLDWLNGLSQEDRDRLQCVFEDREQVVKMWRNHGVVCAQVAPGNF